MLGGSNTKPTSFGTRSEKMADQTGAGWDAPTQLLMTGTQADVDLDGAPLLRHGRYMVM